MLFYNCGILATVFSSLFSRRGSSFIIERRKARKKALTEEEDPFVRDFVLLSTHRKTSVVKMPTTLTTKPTRRPKKVKLGVCAMNKKSHSANMQSILQRLDAFQEFEILVFADEVILNDPIESWPVVDALVSFFSRDFPLEKAHEYVKLRKPFMVNDVTRQWTLLDRRLVYRTLMENNIPGRTGRSAVLMTSSFSSSSRVVLFSLFRFIVVVRVPRRVTFASSHSLARALTSLVCSSDAQCRITSSSIGTKCRDYTTTRR